MSVLSAALDFRGIYACDDGECEFWEELYASNDLSRAMGALEAAINTDVLEAYAASSVIVSVYVVLALVTNQTRDSVAATNHNRALRVLFGFADTNRAQWQAHYADATYQGLGAAELARAALDVVNSDHCELYNAWRDTDNFERWQASIREMSDHLDRVLASP